MTQLTVLEILNTVSHKWPGLALEVTIKATLVLAVAALASWMLRGSSSGLRHQIWAGSLCGLVALPFLSIGLPSWEAAVLPSPTVSPSEHTALKEGANSPGPLAGPEASPRPNVKFRTDSVSGSVARPAVSELKQDTTALRVFSPPDQAGKTKRILEPAVWALALWLAGFSAVLLRYLLGVLNVREILRDARPAGQGAAPIWIRGCEARLGLRRPVRVLVSPRAAVPLAWGWRRPVIVVPREFFEWPAARRRDVLLHELAHVRRGDVAWQFPATLASALFWYHPLVWMAASRLRFEAELACDDLVLAGGAKASEYAALLVEATRGIGRLGTMRLAAASMGASALEDRVRAILDSTRNRRFPSPKLRWGLGLLTVCLIVPLSLVKPIATAQANSVEEVAGPKTKSLLAEARLRSAAKIPEIPASGLGTPNDPAQRADVPSPRMPIRQSQPPQSVLVAQGQPELGSYGSYDLLAQQPAPSPRLSGPSPEPQPAALPPPGPTQPMPLGSPQGVRVGSPQGVLAGSPPQAEVSASPETIRAGVMALASALKSSDPEVRRQAAESLGQMGEAALPAVEDLTASIEDPEPQVQKEALEALSNILRRGGAAESEQAVAAFERVLRSDDPAMRKEAAEALGRMDGAAGPALAALTPALGDPDPEVQKEAAEGIGRLIRHVDGKELSQAVSALSGALPKAPPEVRREIVESLGRLRSKADEVVPVLIKAVDDPDPLVQKEAVEALGRILGRGQRSSVDNRVGAEIEGEIREAVNPEAIKAEIREALPETVKVAIRLALEKAQEQIRELERR